MVFEEKTEPINTNAPHAKHRTLFICLHSKFQSEPTATNSERAGLDIAVAPRNPKIVIGGFAMYIVSALRATARFIAFLPVGARDRVSI